MIDRQTDASLARAADFESWAAVALAQWWPLLTGGLPPPSTTLRSWRALDGAALEFRVGFIARKMAEATLMPLARKAFHELGMTPDENEWRQSRGKHLVGDTADALVRVRFSDTAHTVFIRLESRPCRVSREAGLRLLGMPDENLPFPMPTVGPLDIRVARNSARHLLTQHGASPADPNDPFQLGPPDQVFDVGWAYIFPWSTASWYEQGAPPRLPAESGGPIAVVKHTGHTWMLRGIGGFDTQLADYAREQGIRHTISYPAE
ncbi:hypothetical protein D5S18_09645 [Nocardia panacis]|uniref:Uncharacterized protein n=1 Tax=Nocardia panacis TaxID=2340916 RepID=A0A3A4K9S8_9NOCA|nr:hypothetical protein [Nocardia panacis]RJO76550.1 hypothetical protein D5S18_09645 [Nocardia panacis]